MLCLGGGSLCKAAPLLGIESLNVLYFPFSEATPIRLVFAIKIVRDKNKPL